MFRDELDWGCGGAAWALARDKTEVAKSSIPVSSDYRYPAVTALWKPQIRWLPSEVANTEWTAVPLTLKVVPATA